MAAMTHGSWRPRAPRRAEGALQDVDGPHPHEEVGPVHAPGALGCNWDNAVAGGRGDDACTKVVVRCKDAMEAPQRQVGCWQEGGESRDEVKWLEDNRLDPSFPGALERQHVLAVASALEPVFGNGRAAQVAAEALESLAVVRRDRDLGMELKAPGALCAERLLQSGAPVLGFLLAQDPDLGGARGRSFRGTPAQAGRMSAASELLVAIEPR